MTLTVELPVCPACGTVGKIPRAAGLAIQSKCVGGLGKGHKPTKMEYRTFEEVIEYGNGIETPEDGTQN